MRPIEAVHATALSPGDIITEIDTPDGPWYTVLSLTANSVTLDGSQEPTCSPLAVTLSVEPRDLVLRRPPC